MRLNYFLLLFHTCAAMRTSASRFAFSSHVSSLRNSMGMGGGWLLRAISGAMNKRHPGDGWYVSTATSSVLGTAPKMKDSDERYVGQGSGGLRWWCNDMMV